MLKTILIAGATGKQGGAVVNALLADTTSDYTILAVTRDANSHSAQKLLRKGANVKVVEGNLDDVPSLFAAAAAMSSPIWGVYCVQVSQGKGVTHEGEIRQGKAVIDESLKHGVKCFVYSGVERGGDEKSWDIETPVPHFQSKYHLERYLRDQSGEDMMGWTVLRPVAFMDNWEPGMPGRVFLASLKNNLGDKRLQWIAASDIGHFAALAFGDLDEYNHKAIGLAGDNLNVSEVTKAFETALNYNQQPAFGFLGSVLTTLVSEVGLMVRWFGSDGYRADIEKCRKLHPQLKTFDQWLKTESKFPKS